MATHSSILAWEIPWTEEPGGLQSMGLQKNQTHLSDQTTEQRTYIRCDRGMTSLERNFLQQLKNSQGCLLLSSSELQLN